MAFLLLGVDSLIACFAVGSTGLLANAAVMRLVPGMKRRSTTFMAGFAGAALVIAAPVLLAVG